MACHCGHPGCTVSAHFAEVDHLDEWHRDGGATDIANAGIRCRSHNPTKHRLGLVDRRSKSGQVVTFRRDGTPMLPVGCRLPEFEPDADRLDEMVSSDNVADDATSLIEEGCLLLKQVLHELEQQLEAMAA